jgi:anti-sigma factor RsiW
MNDREFHELLAEYVAGELDDERAAMFRAELDADPARRMLAQQYQAAAAALEAHLLSDEETERRAASLSFEQVASTATDGAGTRVNGLRGRRYVHLRAALRYAAVIALAFGAGFLARGRDTQTNETAPPPAAVDASIDKRLAAKYTQASQSFPESPTFSRSLLMLARP